MTAAVDLILFGALGDLSRRKLFPALYQLDRAGLLDSEVRIAGLARDDISSADFTADIAATLRRATGASGFDEDSCQRFCARLHYLKVDFGQQEQYAAVRQWLSGDRVAIYYLATPPSLFGSIADNLNASQCIDPNSRIVLEKPIGHDLASSQQVNDAVANCFTERNIYRIDHYLGKETVQNLLALRFANRMINSQWDNSCVDHIQITAAETVGIEGRWSYYDNVGQLRDMIQNHVLQLLCMVAMEPPNSLQAEEIRAEKVKILRALSPINAATVADQAVRGQYTAGWVAGKPVVGYMEEEGHAGEKSTTETFVALKAYIDNWRWAGVPFYLRTGKRMANKVTEVVITYKDPPHAIFPDSNHAACGRLIIRLQPNEGIELEMLSKKQSLRDRMSLEKRHLNLDFFDSSGDSRIADAYERLLLEVMKGDQWLFVSREEIEASWSWCDTLLAAWSEADLPIGGYSAGSWGPSKAEMLIEKDQRHWHHP